jgi:hypothetical protein
MLVANSEGVAMRQREWMRCTDPVAMLHQASASLYVPSEADLAATNQRRRQRSVAPVPEFPWGAEAARARRQFRIFTLTAGQPALDRVNHTVCHAAADVAWRLAEGTASATEIAATQGALHAAYDAILEATREYYVAPAAMWEPARLINVLTLLFSEPWGAARELVVPQAMVSPDAPIPLLTSEETQGCCGLIREIFGVRRGVMIPPLWQPFWATDTAVSLSHAMYDSREFGAMPILADALQDAGCDNDDVLSHCRDAALTHVRGCWVVDLVLGKV